MVVNQMFLLTFFLGSGFDSAVGSMQPERFSLLKCTRDDWICLFIAFKKILF